MRAKQFEMARLPLPSNLKSKPNWRILIVCDAALEERLAERLSRELPKLKEESPMFGRMFELENTSSTRFHLCLMIYLILPMATLCRLLWKLVRKAYLEYWVKGGCHNAFRRYTALDCELLEIHWWIHCLPVVPCGVIRKRCQRERR